MRSSSLLYSAAAVAVSACATLQDVCTTAYAASSLPAGNFCTGITIDNSSVVATTVTNVSVSGENFYPDATFDYCNVTFAYSHNGKDDRVLLTLWLPTPADFQNRWLTTGGGGYAINSGNGSLPGGVIYGAAAGITDGGFGGFNRQFDTVFPVAEGVPNYDALFSFGYVGQHELTVLGKEFTRQFFNMSDNKLYAYYQGCSEGGREGWSQVQRYADQWDGAITAAPAFRFSQQQVQHLYSNVVEQTVGYYPPPCELEKILNATIEACDPLDGLDDGTVSRTDLCKLNFNINSTIGMRYYCPAAPAFMGFPPHPATPEQNGTVSAEGVEVATLIINGLKDSEGRQAYLSYQPASAFVDAQTQYNFTSGKWELFISALGSEFVTRYLQLRNTSTLDDLDGITYDTLVQWMVQGWQTYEDTLQTTWPDLTPYQSAGGKVIHFHGEEDDSIPAASSVRYYESVRSIMYPDLSYNDSVDALNEWYRLYLVPGAKHCSPNPLMPNHPFPQTSLQTLIDWVENGVEPVTLNATVLQGQYRGENRQICSWPLRPYWTSNSVDSMICEYDQASIDSWLYDMDAYKLPLY